MGPHDSQPGWMSEDAGRAYNFVNRTYDQKILAKAARQAKHGYVRSLAVQKLTADKNQGVLKRIAKRDESAEVRVNAAIRLKNTKLRQSLLRELIKDESDFVRLSAAKNIDDHQLAQSVLSDLAKNSEFHAYEAAELLDNQDDKRQNYKNIALTSPDSESRKFATKNIDDVSVLLKIAKTDEYMENRLTAIDRLVFLGENESSQKLYTAIAMDEYEVRKYRLTAAEKITDIGKAKLAFASLLRVTKNQKFDVGGGYITKNTDDYERVRQWLDEHK